MILSSIRTSLEICESDWDSFVRESPQGAIYARYGYLTAVCGQWNAIVSEEDGKWIAVLPFAIRKKYLFVYSFTPPFTQYLGLLFSRSTRKRHKDIEWKRAIIQSTIDSIPKKVKLFNHNFSPDNDYLGPFYWSGFRVHAFQSFVLNLEDSESVMYRLFSSGIRDSISKAERRGYSVLVSRDADPLVKLLRCNNLINPKQVEILCKLWKYLSENHMGFIQYALDANGNIVSGGLFLVDSHRVIFLSTATDPAARNSGVHSQLVWEAIKRAKTIPGIAHFDFEGSMIRGVETYFNKFGAKPIFYFNITGNRMRLMTRFISSITTGKTLI